MSWLDNYYGNLRTHNLGDCNPDDCRFCKQEVDVQVRYDKVAKVVEELRSELKNTNVARVLAWYNGGGDEGFVDEVEFLNKDGEQAFIYSNYSKAEVDPEFKRQADQMFEIAWGVLGYGFGTGDFSISGKIELDVGTGKLSNTGYPVSLKVETSRGMSAHLKG